MNEESTQITLEQPLPPSEQPAFPPTDKGQEILGGWQFKAFIITVIASVIGYLLFTIWGGWYEVSAAVAHVGVQGIGIALALSLVNYGLRFIRWQKYLSVLGYEIPWQPSLRIYVSGWALTTTPGKAGEALRSVFLKKYGVTYRKSLAAFFSERIIDLISVIILANFGLWTYPAAQPIVIGVSAVIILMLAILQRPVWLKAIEIIAERLLPKRFGHLVEFIVELVLSFKECFRARILAYGTFLGVLAWGAEGFAFYYLLHLLGSDISLPIALFIYAFGMVVGSVSFLPGGLGGAEVVMYQLLVFYGNSPSIAVAATIVIRLATLWFSVVLGLLALPRRLK